jgi:hypothetical protein
MSNNLDLSQVTAGQNQKEVTINAQAAELDAALTEDLDNDYTSGNVTLTNAEWRENRRFNATNLSVARVLTIPAIAKEGIIDNTDGSDTLTATVGTGTVIVAAGEAVSVKLDGTINHIVQVGGSRQETSPSVQTTNATETDLFTVPVPAGSSVTIRGFGSGIEDSTGDTYGFDFLASARNQGGTTTLKGKTLTKQDPDLTGFDVDIDADDTGDTIRVRVTGVVATTVAWLGRFDVLENAG